MHGAARADLTYAFVSARLSDRRDLHLPISCGSVRAARGRSTAASSTRPGASATGLRAPQRILVRERRRGVDASTRRRDFTSGALVQELRGERVGGLLSRSGAQPRGGGVRHHRPAAPAWRGWRGGTLAPFDLDPRALPVGSSAARSRAPLSYKRDETKAYVKIGTSGTVAWVQHSLHALRGAPQPAAADQVGRGGRPDAAPVSARSHARRSRDGRDQATAAIRWREIGFGPIRRKEN